jgi:hypothetical protein
MPVRRMPLGNRLTNMGGGQWSRRTCYRMARNVLCHCHAESSSASGQMGFAPPSACTSPPIKPAASTNTLIPLTLSTTVSCHMLAYKIHTINNTIPMLQTSSAAISPPLVRGMRAAGGPQGALHVSVQPKKAKHCGCARGQMLQGYHTGNHVQSGVPSTNICAGTMHAALRFPSHPPPSPAMGSSPIGRYGSLSTISVSSEPGLSMCDSPQM